MDTHRKMFIELDLVEKAKDYTFETFSRYICRKDVIDITSKLLSYFKTSLNSREFLSIYIFTYYPEINLSNKKTDLENNLIEKSNEIITLIQTDSSDVFNCDLFNNLCREFAEVFNQWRILDMENLKDELIKTYKSVTSISKKVPDQEFIDKTIFNLEGIAEKVGIDNISK